MVDPLTELADLYIGKENVKTIVEAGALDCKDSIALTIDFPNAHVYAFEANPEQIPVCRKNIEGNQRITLFECALSDITGEELFRPIDTEKTVTTHEDGNPGASSFFKANKEYPFETYVQKEVMVKTLRLDSFDFHPIDILRLDAQGSELNIIRGLGDYINDVKIIQTEVNFKEQYYNVPLADEVIEFLEGKEFRFVRYVTKFEWSGDILMIRENI